MQKRQRSYEGSTTAARKEKALRRKSKSTLHHNALRARTVLERRPSEESLSIGATFFMIQQQYSTMSV